MNNVLREYKEMNEEIKNPENTMKYIKTMEMHCVICTENTGSKNSSVRRNKHK